MPPKTPANRPAVWKMVNHWTSVRSTDGTEASHGYSVTYVEQEGKREAKVVVMRNGQVASSEHFEGDGTREALKAYLKRKRGSLKRLEADL